MATIGRCYYWSHTLARSVRLYTGECVVDSSMGLWDRAANIPIFDGKDKKACLMWLSQCAHTTVNTKMTLKEVLVAKGGPIISTQVQIFMSKTPGATNTELKQHILESFSNVGSRTEAHHYLIRMTVDEDESLLAHNSEYAAVHGSSTRNHT